MAAQPSLAVTTSCLIVLSSSSRTNREVVSSSATSIFINHSRGVEWALCRSGEGSVKRGMDWKRATEGSRLIDRRRSWRRPFAQNLSLRGTETSAKNDDRTGKIDPHEQRHDAAKRS